MKIKRLLVLLIIVSTGNAVLCTPRLSQCITSQRTGTLSGRIVDPGGGYIVGANIYVEGKGFRKSLTSGDDGSYSIELPEGKYKISATHDGFYPSRKKTVRVDSDAHMTINITLKGIRADESHP